MPHQCPGMNPSFWKPEDIKDIKCKVCSEQIEFWKDDIKRTCPICKQVSFNPNLESLCLTWCDKAAECLGDLNIEEWKKQNKNTT